MSNQMIALQSRGAKLPDPAAQTAKFVNMMNMTKQQEAAERQAAQAQQAMTLAQKKDAREEALQGPAVTKAEIDNVRAQIDDLEEQYKMVSTDEGHQFWLGRVRKISPEIADQIGMYVPNFDPEKINNIMLTAKQAADKIDPDAKATIEYAGKGGVDEQGNPVPEGTAIQVITGSKPSTRVIRNAPNASPPAPAAAPQTPTAGAGTNMRATQGANTTPQDLIQQGMDPRNIPSGMPTVRPASFNQSNMSGAGQMTPDMVPAILDSAVNTGVMAQIDLDQMLALAPPQARDGIMNVIRNNKIALQADAPSLAASGMGQQQPMAPNPVQRPQSQFADMRGPAPQSQTAGLRGAPPMEQTLAQYQPLQRRDPNVSPLPGSSQVPLSRVAGEAEARRETPAQITARKNAELQATEAFEEANKEKRLGRKRQEVFEGERAKKDAAFLDSYNDAATKGRTTLNVIYQMIGDAQLEKGKLVVPKGGRRPHPGFEGVVGMGVPGVRFIPGTQAASFDALFRQAEGGAFLQAYESLRGTGQITEIEGSKATSALTRMERSQTEVEFVKAAREFANVIRGAVARADKRYTALTGEAPPAAAAPRRKTPTKGSDGWGKAKVVGN